MLAATRRDAHVLTEDGRSLLLRNRNEVNAPAQSLAENGVALRSRRKPALSHHAVYYPRQLMAPLVPELPCHCRICESDQRVPAVCATSMLSSWKIAIAGAPCTVVGLPAPSLSSRDFTSPTVPTVAVVSSPHWILTPVNCVGSHFVIAPAIPSIGPPFLPVKMASSSRRWSGVAESSM